MIKVILLSFFGGSWVAPMDSLRTESINGQLYVVHQVDAKETLYGISRRYGATVAAILELNPKATTLEVGQILRVPYTAKSKVVKDGNVIHKVAVKETLFSISKLYDVSVDDIKSWNNLTSNSLTVGQELIVKKNAVTAAKSPAAGQKAGQHTVGEKETLYAISRQYGVTVDDLKKWNNLTGNELRVGQVLIVAATSAAGITKVEEKKVLPVVVKEDEPILPVEKTIQISETAAGTDEIKERGMAELIEGTEGNRKYLAHYNGAKPGTIMKVRNQETNQEVFVRVMGPLPEGAGSVTIIRISKSAYDRLAATTPKFGVEVTHYR